MMDASVSEAQRRGVDTLVTIYHACHRELVPWELAADAEEAFRSFRVENYLTTVARALGLPEREDRYKRFAHMADAKLIMAELGPRIAELGLSPDRAKRFISAQFGCLGREQEPASVS
jgi:hypothetical protein